MDLLERQSQLGQLQSWLDDAAAGLGRLVAIGGEAGVGKSALVAAFADTFAGRVDFRIGGCDPLKTPRPLGPLRDLAGPGALTDALVADHAPHEIFSLFFDELRAADRASVVVIEDVHWADEATLDLIRFLGRRVGDLPVMVIVTYRDDETFPDHPTRVMLGDIAGVTAVRRLRVPRSSPEATAGIAARHGLDPQMLYRSTSGNAFFVSEVVASGPGVVPETVRDAVLARAARLDPAARAFLDVASVLPGRAERWLLQRLVGADLRGLDGCLTAGVLVADDTHAVRFRHELSRVAVESAVPVARRLALHQQVADVLRATDPTVDSATDAEVGRAVDPARIVYHADCAGDVDAVLRYAPIAGSCGRRASRGRRAIRRNAALCRAARRR